MIQKIRSIGIIWVLLFVVSEFMGAVKTGEPSCRQKILSICNKNQGSPICKLLTYNEPETVESISAFLIKIRALDPEIHQEMVCARLMGKKQIINLDTNLYMASDVSKFIFQHGIGTFKFKINDPNYAELIKAHQKLKNFKLCPSDDIKFDLIGMVADVDLEYYDNSNGLKSFVFTLDEVHLSNIKTTYATGGFDVQLKLLEKRIDAEEQKHSNAETKKIETKANIKTTKAVLDINSRDLKTYQNSICMEFVLIPVKGEHDIEDDKFACKDEKIMKVSKPYYIGKHEVTQSQWESVMENNPSHFRGSDLPVEQVSWEDVQKFILKLNQREETNKYRLPGEAEWEFAARSGSETIYCFGDDENSLSEYAWYDQNSDNKTHSVGELNPNAWGLYDMHGNVWEWCKDCYTVDSIRVYRGGSWKDPAGDCKSENRFTGDPFHRDHHIGFRLAITPPGH